MRPKYSQNFLVRPGIAEGIVAAMNLLAGDEVLEIGPGRGILTQILLDHGASVTAVEIDPSLAGTLQARWKSSFRLINSDFLDINLHEIFPDISKKIKVIGNLPYAVTSPILQKVMAWNGWSSSVFMVQKEVAERIRSMPGNKSYGVLTVSVQAKCRAEKVFDVPPEAFRPVPKVDSSVLRLTPLERPKISPQNEEKFFKAVKACFAQRRKMAANSLAGALNLTAEQARQALLKAHLSPTARAETYSVDDFVRLSEVL